jgi:hypothetical protein
MLTYMSPYVLLSMRCFWGTLLMVLIVAVQPAEREMAKIVWANKHGGKFF